MSHSTPELRAALVVINGVPKSLAYSFDPSAVDITIGSEVTVQVGARKAKGYVVQDLPLAEAIEIFRTQEVKRPSIAVSNNEQLALVPNLSPPEARSRSLKPVLAAAPAFLPDQMQLFEWMAAYYGAPLADVIDNALPKRTRARKSKIKLETTPSTPMYTGSAPNDLTATQQSALQQISTALASRTFSPTLLHGVTGSGKTEVYLRAIEEVVANGGSALVIVPEIALTPQFLDQFQARLSIPLALLHSQVGAGERWRAWESLLSGELRVAIGARSAVFAPLQNLRLIIVDEEHEHSYKQSEGLRYSARDVAVMRGKFAECPVILGSATPSFESLLNATRGRYSLIEMPERVTKRPLPALEIVDLNRFKRKEMASPSISPTLFEAMKSTLERKGQIVILYNRRGFSSYLQCESCSEVVLCPNCSVALTFHRKRDKLVCHYCNLTTAIPAHCHYCRNPKMSRVEKDSEGKPTEREKVVEAVGQLVHRGSGTERVVDEIIELFPEATIVRMDRDTVTDKGAYRRILGDMRSGQADILVGTQMIAKGHDLPGVTLVGIIDADVGLHFPDFRSSEKVFQLITQAAGRAGRGKEPGRVIVQTREPNHPTIVATATGRFKAFARFELDHRKTLNYPPWGRLLRLIVSSPDRQDAFRAAEATATRLGELTSTLSNGEQCTILGPAPAPHERLRGRYRWHLLVKCGSAKTISALAHALTQWRQTVKDFRDFRLSVDVDPVDML